MVVALLTTALLIVNLHPEIWKGLLEERILTLIAIGVSLTAIIVLLAIGGAASSWTGFRGKTVWDLLQLLIVPLMLVAIGLVFSLQQDARQQRVENQRAAAERELAEQRAQDEALQAYLDQMGDLLLAKDGLRESAKDSEVRTLARARTLTVLSRLDSARKERLLQFLYEAGLLHQAKPVINLNGADLSSIDLHMNNLSGAGAFLIDESPNQLFVIAKLEPSKAANLSGAILSDANLEHAFLNYIDLSDANLSDANLRNADLDDANLIGADLSDADLGGTDLSDASLRWAHLRGVQGITEEELNRQAKSLDDATMPDGQKYEDWLKSKVREEDG
jgi:uncharacterized protein YjbI with pentapeptide repeats